MRIIKLIAYLTEEEARVLAVFIRADGVAHCCKTLFTATDLETMSNAGYKIAGALADNGFLSK